MENTKNSMIELDLSLVNENSISNKFTLSDKQKSLLSEDYYNTEDLNTSRQNLVKKDPIAKKSLIMSNPISIKLHFGPKINDSLRIEQDRKYGLNRILTTKYNILTWFPKSLLMQFKRFANVYFLFVTVLQCMSFSPKSPQTQIFTFFLVLLFTMIKEAIEDYKRYKMDNEINNKSVAAYNYINKKFENKKWQDLKVGEIVKIHKNNPIPADLFLFKSSLDSGLCFVDTKDLDGETNLKEKMINTAIHNSDDETLLSSEGVISCSEPNELMESWEANIFVKNMNLSFSCNIKQLLLKGSILRNTEFIYGIVVYCGHNTKIMKNAKNPPMKMSHVVKMMNTLLLSLFVFLVIMCICFSVANFVFSYENNQSIIIYISINSKISIYSLIIKFLTFIAAYSHLTPISLYVAMEIVKVMQSYFIFYDEFIYDKHSEKPTQARTSELIEELGQIDIIFSDKTGTLTKNSMEFKKCLIGQKIYGDICKDEKKEILSQNHDVTIVKHHINGDSTAYAILESDKHDYPSCIVSNSDKAKIIEFFMVSSICHSAIAEKDVSGILKYASMSPDEIALINGAKEMGFVFTNRTTDIIEVFNEYNNKSEKWEVLYEIPFDSDRKRMTLFVKNKEDPNNYVYVLSKGADNMMLPRLNLTEFTEKSALGKIKKYLINLRCTI